MGILDQIENIMDKKIVSDQGYIIKYYSMMQPIRLDKNLNYFVSVLDKDENELPGYFSSKNKMSIWLIEKGFKIYTENKS